MTKKTEEIILKAKEWRKHIKEKWTEQFKGEPREIKFLYGSDKCIFFHCSEHGGMRTTPKNFKKHLKNHKWKLTEKEKMMLEELVDQRQKAILTEHKRLKGERIERQKKSEIKYFSSIKREELYNCSLVDLNLPMNELIDYLNTRKWVKQYVQEEEIKKTSTGTGFLLPCPNCKNEQKSLYYGKKGKMFVCLKDDCRWKIPKLSWLKEISRKSHNNNWKRVFVDPIQEEKKRKQSLVKHWEKILENRVVVHVDYALYGMIGIYCKEFETELSITPTEDIKWQIEGEALAIKKGVEWYLENKKDDRGLIIFTDNLILLHPFDSHTQAGGWWWEAKSLMKKAKIEFMIKFVKGVDNLADKLTRTEEHLARTKSRNSHYYKQRFLKEQELKKNWEC